MKTIDVCLSPELMHLYDVRDRTVVVVDILRATSCMVTAFANGVDSITPFANLDQCLKMKTRGYITFSLRIYRQPSAGHEACLYHHQRHTGH
jgi:2-phosphosulfolactate phosphatase